LWCNLIARCCTFFINHNKHQACSNRNISCTTIMLHCLNLASQFVQRRSNANSKISKSNQMLKRKEKPFSLTHKPYFHLAGKTSHPRRPIIWPYVYPPTANAVHHSCSLWLSLGLHVSAIWTSYNGTPGDRSSLNPSRQPSIMLPSQKTIYLQTETPYVVVV